MGRGVDQIVVGFECGLRAVAVVDVEIDDRHPVEAVRLARPQRPDGGVVEQAKAHRPVGFGVMARRAHRAKGVVGLSATTASTAAMTAPAACRAAVPEAGENTVSASIATWPDLGTAPSTRSRWRREWTRSTSSSAACGASRRSSRANSGPLSARQNGTQPVR